MIDDLTCFIIKYSSVRIMTGKNCESKNIAPPPQKIKMIKQLPIINTIVYEFNNVCKMMSRMRPGRRGILWTSGDT